MGGGGGRHLPRLQSCPSNHARASSRAWLGGCVRPPPLRCATAIADARRSRPRPWPLCSAHLCSAQPAMTPHSTPTTDQSSSAITCSDHVERGGLPPCPPRSVGLAPVWHLPPSPPPGACGIPTYLPTYPYEYIPPWQPCTHHHHHCLQRQHSTVIRLYPAFTPRLAFGALSASWLRGGTRGSVGVGVVITIVIAINIAAVAVVINATGVDHHCRSRSTSARRRAS